MGGDITMKKIGIYVALLMSTCVWIPSASAATAQQQIAELSKTSDGNGVLSGKEGWLFLKEELEHLSSEAYYGEKVLMVSKAAKPEFADPVPGIVDFYTQLKNLGIELIFVPIPPKALIYPQYLPGNISVDSVKELERPYEEFYGKLRQEGVTVLDLIPLYRRVSKEKQLYCKTDTHFSGQGLSLVASELIAMLSKRDWLKTVEKKSFTNEERVVSIHGDLSQMQKSDTREDLTLNFVQNGVTSKLIEPDPDSPVLLLGDSHTLVFSVGGDLHASGAGLFDQLSAAVGSPIDLLGVRGSGATASRIKLYQRSRKDASFLSGKKVVIWCLSAREFTGSGGWRKIPVAKKK
jgi:alginate O-acetyltransferase complex protein AlgJ